jgi:hypothetical protein
MKLTPIIAKQHYFKPGEDNRLGLWKFITYLGNREGANEWIDRGMGATREDLLRLSDEKRSRFTQMRDLTFATDPHLMKFIPEDRRHHVMSRTVERSMSRWYRENHWGEADYSYILHDKAEDGSDGTSHDKLHAHVLMPGTVQPDPCLARRHVKVTREHVEDLRRTASACFIREMERELGRDVVQEILRERDAQIERERAAKHREKDGPSISEVAGVIGIMKQEEERKKREKEGKQASKKAKQRAQDRLLRLELKRRQQADRDAARDLRRKARDERLAERERLHQEKLAELRRQEQARNNPPGFYPDFFGMDLD